MDIERRVFPVVGLPFLVEYRVYNSGDVTLKDAVLEDVLFEKEKISITLPPIHP